ncbi:MAG: tetratricopeptide repeat-containing protein, partial [Cyanothece sp. SIO2G6]|nr:tetratricopeptide repeat-containing protein [Cyanothece sp. SIO2G6]
MSQEQASMSNILPPATSVLQKLDIDPTLLKAIQPPSKRSQYRAIVNWITQYHPSDEATELEVVKGWLEAFHHLCEVGEWEKAAQLLFTKLHTSINEEFHDQLDVWGHHTELNQLYERVVHQLPPQFNAIVLNSMGRLWTTLGEYEKAIAYHEQSLAIDRELGQTAGVGASLGNLGVIYASI